VLGRFALILSVIHCAAACGGDAGPVGADADVRGARDGGPIADSRTDTMAAGDASESGFDAGTAPRTCPDVARASAAPRIESTELVETSGLAASRRHADVLWAHNDSGDTPRLFAMRTDGRHLGVYRLAGARAADWEDMEIAGDQIYVGDIGDNGRARPRIVVYRVTEPDVSADQAPVDVEVPLGAALPMVYPDRAHDAETLLVDPATGEIYVVTKSPGDGVSLVFRYPLPERPDVEVTLELVSMIAFGAGGLGAASVAATAGDVSPAGDLIAVRTYTDAYLWHRSAGMALAEALASDPCEIPLAGEPQGETIAFDADGLGYRTISEGTRPTVFAFGWR